MCDEHVYHALYIYTTVATKLPSSLSHIAEVWVVTEYSSVDRATCRHTDVLETKHASQPHIHHERDQTTLGYLTVNQQCLIYTIYKIEI